MYLHVGRTAELGLSAVRRQYRSSAQVYQRTHAYLNRSGRPVVCFQFRKAALNLEISTKSVQRDVRGMEEDGLIRTERLHGRDGLWTGYRVFFLKRQSAHAEPAPPVTKQGSTRLRPELICAQRLFKAIVRVDRAKLRRVRSKVLRELEAIAAPVDNELWNAVGIVLRERRRPRARSGAPSPSAELRAEARPGLLTW